MRLSTFASDQPHAARFIALLLALSTCYCGTLEFAARAGLKRISHVQRRIDDSNGAAVRLQPITDSGAKTVLLVGNSLVVHGVDPGELRQYMAPRYYSSVLAIENTQYLDWYFGLRRLFAEGSRPALVVVCLTPRQLISRGINGEYFAYYMMQEKDIVQVKREAHLDNTVTSNLFFANQSAWLGSRSAIRNWLLSELMPNLDQLMSYLPDRAAPLPPDDIVIAESLSRLREMQQLCNINGARFVLVLPPVVGLNRIGDALSLAAAGKGIVVLNPVRGLEMPTAYFSDGFHLNARGAAVFTEKLGLDLVRPISWN